MFRPENIPLLGHGYVCIDFRNMNGTVPQHLLNIADIHVCFQQTCGKGMPEHVGCDMQLDGSERGVFVDHSADGLIRQGSARLRCEEMPAVFHLVQKSVLVILQSADDHLISDLDLSFLGTFSIDQDAFIIQIYIVDL